MLNSCPFLTIEVLWKGYSAIFTSNVVKVKWNLPVEAVEEMHQLSLLKRVFALGRAAVQLACDANGSHSERNVCVLLCSSSPGGCPSLDGESWGKCSPALGLYRLLQSNASHASTAQRVLTGAGLCCCKAASLLKENQHLMVRLMAVPHMPGLTAHRPCPPVWAAVMPHNVTAVPWRGWCSAVPRLWQGCNWFVGLGSIFLQASTQSCSAAAVDIPRVTRDSREA